MRTRMSTYTVDLLDDVFENEGDSKAIFDPDGVCSDVFEHHLHGRLIQFEGFDLCSRCNGKRF